MAKTLKQIEERLQAYKKGTVDSPNRVKASTSYDRNYGVMEAGAIDADKWYHAQCADLTIDYISWLTDGEWVPQGNAKDYPHMSFPSGFKVHKNLPSTVAKTGWIAVYTTGKFTKWGHIGIVYSPGNTNSFTIIEQNWNGYANKKPQTRKDYYEGLTHFIEVPYAKSSSKPSVSKPASKPANKPSFKKKKILIVSGHGNNDPGAVGNGTTERDFIRQYIAPNVVKYLKSAGHDADLYGGSKQNQNLFVDTQYGAGYGLYWVKAQKYDVVVELHLDAAGASASGGHVIISTAYPADKIDKNIDAMLRKTVGTIRGIDPRNNLLNANVSGQLNINYRLVELGFITNKKDMDYLKKNYMAFSKDLASAINDGAISGSTSSAPVAKPSKPVVTTAPKGWKVNKYGTYYKAEKGKFTNGNKPIQVRTVGPFLSSPKAYKFQPGGWCNYDEVMLQAGFVWIGYTWKGKRYYLPVRTWNGRSPGNGYSVGPAWGKFSS